MAGHSMAGHSMTAALRSVMVCSPRDSGWENPESRALWQELGFLRTPDFQVAQTQHQALCRELTLAGAQVICLPAFAQATLDAVYAHDASFITDFGVIVLNPGKASRRPEARQHRLLWESLEIPLLGELAAPATAEAGDMVWLDGATLLVGSGYRTNEAGIGELRNLLGPRGIQVIAASLPYGAGPSACLHLMSLISLLDARTAIVDLPWLSVRTVELLEARGYRLIEMDSSERESLACNVLALGPRRLLALEENPRTNQRLRDAGFEVRTFAGSELGINGGGGPTCLTRPLRRA